MLITIIHDNKKYITNTSNICGMGVEEGFSMTDGKITFYCYIQVHNASKSFHFKNKQLAEAAFNKIEKALSVNNVIDITEE